MFNISQYLKKFTRITPPDSAVRESAARIIKHTYYIDIPQASFSVNNKVLHIKTSPGIKSKLFIHKKTLLTHIAQDVGEGVITDIR